MADSLDTSARKQDRKTKKYLYVIIHGYGSSRLKFLQQQFPKPFNAYKCIQSLKRVIEIDNSQDGIDSSNVDFYCPDFTKELSIASTYDLNLLVNDVLSNIDDYCEQNEYSKIYIIGYSTGAIIARKVYICACGSYNEMPLEDSFTKDARVWADKVDRIILLAGINRGWTINPHLSLTIAALWSLGAGWGNMMMLINKENKPIIFATRKGSPSLIQLCIQWLYMRRNVAKTGLGKAITIQLLGTKDDLISPEDNIDPISGDDFVYLEIPFSNHTNVLDLEIPPEDEQQVLTIPEQRGEVFLSALKDDPDTLKTKGRKLIHSSALSSFGQQAIVESSEPITDVIFVIHGIRDEGHWTNKIAQRVILENKEANLTRPPGDRRYFAIETSRYGYFPMLLFALPWTRRAKVAWFMNQYAENLALYPDAEFSFIGHSNGTYLLAQALEKYQGCRFKRVVFAGSVVPKEYQWSKYINDGRVGRVLNYVATADWVVAIFPNFLHWFQSDLGSAGHDGFVDTHPQVTNIKYLKGQHGAALSEYNWDAIAQFVVSDNPDLLTTNEAQPLEIFRPVRGKRSQDSRLVQKFEQFIEVVSKFPWLVWIGIIAIVSVIGLYILSSALGEWQKTCILALYAWLIWKVLTII